jgi:hypothetical protein
MRQGWTEVAFTEIAKLERRPVEVVADWGSIRKSGCAASAKDCFTSRPRSGLEVGDKKLFRLQARRLHPPSHIRMGRERLAVVNAEDESLLGSVRVLTFRGR